MKKRGRRRLTLLYFDPERSSKNCDAFMTVKVEPSEFIKAINLVYGSMELLRINNDIDIGEEEIKLAKYVLLSLIELDRTGYKETLKKMINELRS